MSQFITYHKQQEFNTIGAICIPVNILSKAIRDLITQYKVTNERCWIRKNNNNTSIFIQNHNNPITGRTFDRIDIIEQ